MALAVIAKYTQNPRLTVVDFVSVRLVITLQTKQKTSAVG